MHIPVLLKNHKIVLAKFAVTKENIFRVPFSFPQCSPHLGCILQKRGTGIYSRQQLELQSMQKSREALCGSCIVVYLQIKAKVNLLPA
jgi:hypothetical protein